jgi:hypothetical protein
MYLLPLAVCVLVIAVMFAVASTITPIGAQLTLQLLTAGR